jgi:hypothetical protein
VLAGVAVLLIVVYRANVTNLIQLYIVGVFVSFTLSQLGMIRHWNRLLPNETVASERRRMIRSRATNAVGFVMTGAVLFIVLITKFTKGAWIVCIAMPVLYWLMQKVHQHYQRVKAELAPEENETVNLPARTHALVLVSKVHKPTMRALAYARASRPDRLEGITVNVDPPDTELLVEEWERRGIPVTLRILDSPYREITRPIVDYVKTLHRENPRDLVVVYIPEYVVGKWWEHLLHNQSALRLKAKLLFTPGVVVCNVPYQLSSSAIAAEKPISVAAGAVRRGEPPADIQEARVAREYVESTDGPGSNS